MAVAMAAAAVTEVVGGGVRVAVVSVVLVVVAAVMDRVATSTGDDACDFVLEGAGDGWGRESNGVHSVERLLKRAWLELCHADSVEASTHANVEGRTAQAADREIEQWLLGACVGEKQPAHVQGKQALGGARKLSVRHLQDNFACSFGAEQPHVC